MLGLPRTTLIARMRKLGISRQTTRVHETLDYSTEREMFAATAAGA